LSVPFAWMIGSRSSMNNRISISLISRLSPCSISQMIWVMLRATQLFWCNHLYLNQLLMHSERPITAFLLVLIRVTADFRWPRRCRRHPLFYHQFPSAWPGHHRCHLCHHNGDWDSMKMVKWWHKSILYENDHKRRNFQPTLKENLQKIKTVR